MTPPKDTENPPKDSDENLTVVVFRQNDASRSFQVSLRWIRQLGWLAGALVLITLVSVILTLRFYRESKIAEPSRVQELERDLRDLKQSYLALESKSATPASPLPQQAAIPLTQTPSALPTGATVMAEPTGMPFSLFPGGTQAIPAPDSRPIQIAQPKVTLSGRTVRAKFAFQYVADDQGSQQGRFLLLARGADSLHVYPDGALGAGQASSLILPEKGEYFSVSRYREVSAEFALGSHEAVPTSIEIYVFTTDGKLYMHHTLPVTATPKPKSKPPVASDSAQESAPARNSTSEAAPAPATHDTDTSTGGSTQ